MESARLAYKTNDLGNDIYNRVSWDKEHGSGPRPIGSSEIVPQAQIDYFRARGFVVVIPNYRLVPQVTGKDALIDAEEAYDWVVQTLPGLLSSEHGFRLDTSRVVAMGHSSGGVMVLHLASLGKPLKAITALYPSVFVSDRSTNGHTPADDPFFQNASEYAPTEDEWAEICPAGRQVSEAPMDWGVPRNRCLMQLMKTGTWLQQLQPNGDFAAIDPLTRINSNWPPVMLLHGSEDNVSGRSAELLSRAEQKLKAAGVKEVELEIVPGVGHLFDHSPAVGTSDLGAKWQAVVKGMNWLKDRA